MSKKIFVTPEEFEAIAQNVKQKLDETKDGLAKKKFLTDTDEKITIELGTTERDQRTATVLFTPKAWIKMQMLVRSFSTEVEWHGTARRIDDGTFIIDDILIFPYEVTGTTAISDQSEYEAWLDTLDTETFNNMRFHGHSHVNMAVMPSGTDMDYRHAIVNTLGKNTFYIFLIANKSGDMSAEIYDLQKNALYSTKYNEISIEVMVDDDEYLNEFELEAKRLVRPQTTPIGVQQHKGKNKKGGGTPCYSTYVSPYAGSEETSKVSKIQYGYGGYYGGWDDDCFGE